MGKDAHLKFTAEAENGYKEYLNMLEISQEVQTSVDQQPLVGQWFEAVKRADQAQMEVLLGQGVVIDLQDEEGFTALRWAAFKGHSAIVQWLLDMKANPAIACHQKKTAVHWAAEQKQNTVETFEQIVRWYQHHQQSLPQPLGPIHDALLVGVEEKRRKGQVVGRIDWSRCEVDDAVVSKLILQLQDCKTLKELNLAHNRITHSGAVALTTLLLATPSLTAFNLSGNAIGNRALRWSGARYIFDAMARSNQITDLRVANCQLGKADVQTLLDALAKNRSLKFLDVAQNQMLATQQGDLRYFFVELDTLSEVLCEGFSAGMWLEKGRKLTRSKKYHEALAAFDRALEFNRQDQNEAIWCAMAVVLHELDRNNEALTICEQVLWLNSKHKEALSNKGNALCGLGHYTEALEICEEALKLDDKYIAALNGKGNALYGLNRYVEALAAYEEAGNSTEALRGKGNVLCQLGRYADALAAYRQAKQWEEWNQRWEVTSDLQSKRALRGEGAALLALGRYTEALVVYQEILNFDAQSKEAWNGKGRALYALGHSTEALAAHEEVLKLDAQDKEAWNGKGRALSALGCYADALAAHEEVLTLDAQGKEAWDGG
jgi:tetratricopeptide (TPR) repeat protein